jgi:hypothetical protein
MTTRRYVPHAAAAAILGVALAVSMPATGEGHKAITSKFTFNEDMFPLFRDKCGACHVDGGVAPMSLLTHEDAAPWGESLRLELLGDEPPKPWHTFTLTAREFDMILVWANGGSPRGDVANAPPPMTVTNEWRSGEPDVAVKTPPFVLAADKNEAMVEHTVPLQAAAGRQIAAVDLRPGTPAIVRSARISIKQADGTVVETVTWQPGAPTAVALKSPLKLGAGASLVAAVEYKRTWKYEGQEMRDESTIGLYATAASKAPPKPSTTRPPGRLRH